MTDPNLDLTPFTAIKTQAAALRARIFDGASVGDDVGRLDATERDACETVIAQLTRMAGRPLTRNEEIELSDAVGTVAMIVTGTRDLWAVWEDSDAGAAFILEDTITRHVNLALAGGRDPDDIAELIADYRRRWWRND
jgi:hypothetical protein